MRAVKTAARAHTAKHILDCRRAIMWEIGQPSRQLHIDGGGITAGAMITHLVMKGSWRRRKSELGYWANVVAMHLKAARRAELRRRLKAGENKAIERKVVEYIIAMLKKREKMR